MSVMTSLLFDVGVWIAIVFLAALALGMALLAVTICWLVRDWWCDRDARNRIAVFLAAEKVAR